MSSVRARLPAAAGEAIGEAAGAASGMPKRRGCIMRLPLPLPLLPARPPSGKRASTTLTPSTLGLAFPFVKLFRSHSQKKGARDVG